MLFRLLLLCALVLYVAVIAASPIENKEVGVDQDIDFTDLEDISIEGEVISQNSEEHPESAGYAGFGKLAKKTKAFGKKVTSLGRIAVKKVQKVADNAKATLSRKLNKLKGGKPARASSSRKSDHKLTTHQSHRTLHHDKSKDYKPISLFGGSGIHLQRNTTDHHSSFFGSVGQGISSAATIISGEGASTLVDRINQLADGILPQPQEHYNDPEDDYYGDDDNNEDPSDYESYGDSCEKLAEKYCLEEIKSSDPERCMADYDCSS